MNMTVISATTHNLQVHANSEMQTKIDF